MGKPNENNQTEQVKQVKPAKIDIWQWKNTAGLTAMGIAATASPVFLAATIASILLFAKVFAVAALPASLGFLAFFANPIAILVLLSAFVYCAVHAVSSYQQMSRHEELKVKTEELAKGAEIHVEKAREQAQAAEKAVVAAQQAQAEAKRHAEGAGNVATSTVNEAIKKEGERLLTNDAKAIAHDVAEKAAQKVVGDMAQTAINDAAKGNVVTPSDLANAIKDLVKANDLEGQVKKLQAVIDLINLVNKHEVALNGEAGKSTGLVQDFAARMKAIEEKFTNGTAKNTDLISEVKKLIADMADKVNQADFDPIKAAVGSKTDNTGVFQEIGNIDTRVKAAEETLAGSKNGKSLAQQITANGQAIVDLEGVVGKTATDGLRKEVAGLTGRVGANETKIGNKANSADNINEANLEVKVTTFFQDNASIFQHLATRFKGIND